MSFEQIYVLDPIARQSRIEKGERISRFAFEVSLYNIYDYALLADRNICQVVLGLFSGTSVVLIMMQLVIRIHLRHKLYIDDCVLLFGLTCLGAATYFDFTHSRLIFLHNALRIKPKIVPSVNELMQLQNSMKILHSFLALIWTTTFFVKFSFLIFFRQLIDRVSKRITIYFWIVVIFIVFSWMFIVSEPFILCPYFDFKACEFSFLPPPPNVMKLNVLIFVLAKCVTTSDKVSLALILNTFVTILDIVTDILSKSTLRIS